jgi:hypothetical protein
MGVQHHDLASLPRETDLEPIVQEAGRAPGAMWTGAENLTRTGIRSSDRPARTESLYGLRYTDPYLMSVL